MWNKNVIKPRLGERLSATYVNKQWNERNGELMDKIILDLTKQNIEQLKNRFFVEGDPAAILMIEFRGQTLIEAENQADQLTKAFQTAGFGYAFPKVFAPDTKKIWDLRNDWWAAETGFQEQPEVERLIFLPGMNEITMAQMMIANEIDMAFSMTPTNMKLIQIGCSVEMASQC